MIYENFIIKNFKVRQRGTSKFLDHFRAKIRIELWDQRLRRSSYEFLIKTISSLRLILSKVKFWKVKFSWVKFFEWPTGYLLWNCHVSDVFKFSIWAATLCLSKQYYLLHMLYNIPLTLHICLLEYLRKTFDKKQLNPQVLVTQIFR